MLKGKRCVRNASLAVSGSHRPLAIGLLDRCGEANREDAARPPPPPSVSCSHRPLAIGLPDLCGEANRDEAALTPLLGERCICSSARSWSSDG
nr:unnamed protein product [Digitaria exilis]